MKSIATVILIVLICACAQKRLVSQPAAQPSSVKAPKLTDTVLLYHSAANDNANLQLSMLANHTFKFHIQTIPLDDPKAIDESLLGTWKENNNTKRLFFKAQHKPLVQNLFDSLGAQNKQFVIVNDSVVDINDQLSSIFIGGILCEKRKLRP